MCTLYTYMNTCMPRFSPSGFFGPSRCLIPTPGLTSEYPICVVCDLLEQTYEGTTVRLAPNDEESVTITFITGVAQGSITSPQLFNIFINALLRMLIFTGQHEDISHGL